MSHKVFAVHDSKTEAFLNPVLYPTAGLAIRELEKAMQNPESDFAKFPQDFCFFEIGTWDERLGVYTMHETKINLGILSSLTRSEEI